jgi:hypothetical protein
MNPIPWTLGFALVLTSVAGAQPQVQAARKAFVEGQRRLEFSMREKPWKEVVDWLVDRSGLVYVGSSPPNGTFNFVPPNKAGHTFIEVIDIVNEGLAPHDLQLIRRNVSFSLVPKGAIDPSMVRRIEAPDLDKQGKSEIVQIVVRLKALDAEKFAAEAKKQLGPFGSVVPLPAARSLLVQDAAGVLRRLMSTIEMAEAAAKK